MGESAYISWWLRPDVLTCLVVMTDVVSDCILGSLAVFPICQGDRVQCSRAVFPEPWQVCISALDEGKKIFYQRRLGSKSQAGLLQLCPRPYPRSLLVSCGFTEPVLRVAVTPLITRRSGEAPSPSFLAASTPWG